MIIQVSIQKLKQLLEKHAINSKRDDLRTPNTAEYSDDIENHSLGNDFAFGGCFALFCKPET